MKKEDFTFVITTFHSEKILDECIKNLPKECKKIVIENSGNAKLKEYIEKKYKNLKCYVMDKNLGYGKANNFGVNKSNTKYIFIINPDVILRPDKFDEIIENIQNEKFSIAAPIEKNNKISFKEKIQKVDKVKGFALIIRRDVALATPFDENIFLYLEEIDLCKRVRDNKGEILLINSQVEHLGGLSHGNKDDFEMEKSRNWHWMWSSFYFYKKHYGFAYGLIRTFPKLFSSIFKYFYFKIVNKEKEREKYKMRYLGLINSYFLRKSHYRPYERK